MNEEYKEIRNILMDYHGGMTTMQVAQKYNLEREDVLQLIELEATDRLNDTVFV